MGRTVAIGIQNFAEIITNNVFYIDKTHFIKEWWESRDSVTLIARPRRFGKTLNMSMLEQFFSIEYADRGDLFEGLSIWNEEEYRELQGTYPVISLSFARVKEKDFATTRDKICEILTNLYIQFSFLRDSGVLTDKDREYFDRVSSKMGDSDATSALYQLSNFLYRYYGKKVIILLDEYDTPMQEAYVSGFWKELTSFIRSLFNSTFKTNPYLDRAIMTGITRWDLEAPSSLGSKRPRQVSEVGFPTRLEKTSPSSQCQSIFSDLNNLEVVTTTSEKYATAFGFTEQEVFEAMEELGLTEKEKVKKWYDGFLFGKVGDIYNPWSILNYLDKGKFSTYWANTSSNSLVSKLIRQGSGRIKEKFETLLQGESIKTNIDEQIVYNQLDDNEEAIWSLLLASGYLKVIKTSEYVDLGNDRYKQPEYELTLTNLEVQLMFENMVLGWFKRDSSNYNDFILALLKGDKKAMNAYMNRVALSTFSYFDTGNRPSGAEPERFYHGFVLGLLVELSGRYVLTSNRESGFGRYDVLLEPTGPEDDGIILEFKVYDEEDEGSLEDTVASALAQIEEKQYDQILIAHGVPAERIRKYGFAFEGKKVKIG